MSLILEALKKSEAERQLGRAPGLMSPTLRVTKRRGPSPWWGVLGLAVALLGGAAWWVNREPSQTADPVAAPAQRVPADASPSREPAPPPAPAPASQTRAPDIAPPAPARVPMPAAPLPDDPEFVSVERESLPVDATPSDGVVSAPPPPKPTPPPIPATVPPIAPLPAPPTAEADAPLPTVDATPAPAQPAAPADAPLETLPTLAELMPDVRGALPALKLSMHVYSAEPAGRFVLIDGKRLVQGESLAPTLTLSEIRRDGAVLDFGGKRFLVPRP